MMKLFAFFLIDCEYRLIWFLFILEFYSEPILDFLIKLSDEELMKELKKTSYIPNELLEDVADQIRTKAETLLRTRTELLLNNVQTVSVQDQKRAHAQLQETLSTLYDNICIFEDGASTFEG